MIPSSPSDLAAWTELWRELKATGDAARWHARLLEGWADPARRYHDRRHLEECLVELDRSRPLAANPARVAAALWFHDVIYDPRSSSNEEDSATLATQCLRGAGVGIETVETVNQLILCTKSHAPGAVVDAPLLIDIDLAILGQPPARFWEYERDIRAEYAWVPAAAFREKRADILTRFLARPSLYHTEAFRRRYETAARANLQAAIARLLAPSS
jgi:predicted metal-dependent HD superfamily phosphohydrolase